MMHRYLASSKAAATTPAMRLSITGLNGTAAPKVATCAQERGWQVQGWDRNAVAPTISPHRRASWMRNDMLAALDRSFAHDGWTFERIVRALAQRFERPHWRVEASDDYRHDQRLVGGPGHMPPLSSRL